MYIGFHTLFQTAFHLYLCTPSAVAIYYRASMLVRPYFPIVHPLSLLPGSVTSKVMGNNQDLEEYNFGTYRRPSNITDSDDQVTIGLEMFYFCSQWTEPN